jgi:3-oxoacyl-[acyl-carrier-protein] synthase-1
VTVYIQAAGMACPVGLRWASACAAMRAGISRRQVSQYRDDQLREIVASHLNQHLPVETRASDRREFLLTCALRDLAESAGTELLQRAMLFVALPPARPGLMDGAERLAEQLSRVLSVRIRSERIHVVAEGSCGSLQALELARQRVREGEPAVVAAADCLLDARELLELSKERRLLVEGQPDGVIPGEAAAAVLLGGSQPRALARLIGLGFGQEEAKLDNDVPLRSEGLVGAARVALSEAGLTLQDVHFRVSDAAGESFHFKEQALVVSRLLRARKADFPLWLPAESLGYTRVAAGLCGVAWALAAWARGYAPGGRAICFAGCTSGRRAAAVLEAAG